MTSCRPVLGGSLMWCPARRVSGVWSASVTASRLGLIEYAAIPPAGRVSPVDSTDADASPAGRSLLCLVLPAPRLPQRARSGSRAGMASVIFHTAVISIVISVAAWSRSTARAPDAAAEPMRSCPGLSSCCGPSPAAVVAVAATGNYSRPHERRRSGRTGSPCPSPSVSRSGLHHKTTRRLHRRCFSKRNRWHRERP